MPFTPALAQRVFPSRSILRETSILFAGVALVALLAQVRVDLWPVPITGQTLGVLLVGAVLGFRRGTAAMALYVGLGLCGAPLFAGWSGGLSRLVGPTGGYLIGFVFSAGTIGLLAEHGYLRTYAKTVFAMVVATTPIFVLGVAWLMSSLPVREALHHGLWIFLPGAAIKIALATLLVGRSGRRVASAPRARGA